MTLVTVVCVNRNLCNWELNFDCLSEVCIFLFLVSCDIRQLDICLQAALLFLFTTIYASGNLRQHVD
jgi:hypothetical protein